MILLICAAALIGYAVGYTLSKRDAETEAYWTIQTLNERIRELERGY